MTTTPTASPELPDLDRLEALARAATPGPWSYTGPEYGDRGGQFHNVESPVEEIVGEFGPSKENADLIAAADPDVVLALIALARRAQPEGEAPQAEPAMWVQYIAGVKTQNVARDDKEKATVESIHRTMAPGTKMTWRALYDHAPAATLSPLCGAQHAESELDHGETVLKIQEAFGITTTGWVSPDVILLRIRQALAAQQAAAPTWGAVHTVGDMVRNLLTLDQAAPIFTAFHVTIDGERRCRTREVIISKERVVDGKWIDSARKDVPYTHIIWAKPDERAPSAPGTPEAPKPPFPISDEEMAALRRFWECATDCEGYDVDKSMMQRLAEMGLVQRKSGAYYVSTDFGLYVLGEYTVQRAAELDGGQEGSESNG